MVLSLEIFGCHLPETPQIKPPEINFYEITPLLESPKLNLTKINILTALPKKLIFFITRRDQESS